MGKIINKIKENIKVFAIFCTALFVFSIYLALMFRHLFMGNCFEAGVFTLLKDIPLYGFPFGGVITMFLLIIGSICVMTWYINREEFEKDDRNFKYSNSGVYGTAGLLTENELGGYANVNTPNKANGTILGQLDQTGKRLINTDMDSRMNKHVAVFGCSGSGKSRCYARPFLIQTVKRRESVIVTDPKGELYESTAQYMKDNGYIVKVLDLVHPELSDGWNCLKELRGDEIRAQIFSNVIIQNTGSGKGDIWDTSAMALLKALLLRVERGRDFKEKGEQSIGDAYQLIQDPQGEKHLDNMFLEYSMSKEEKVCLGPYMTFKQGSDNMRGNIITGLATRLQVFQNDVIKKITAEDDIDLTLPATKPCAYYCIMSDQHTTLNFLSTLFFSFLFIDLVEYADLHGGRCPVPVNFLLDEFPNIGSIPDFDKKIATVRSRLINISIIFQGVTQLQSQYPNNLWTSILGNCDTHLFLGCNEEETARFISDRAGETTVKVGTTQHDKYESPFTLFRKHSSGDGKRKIFNPDEIMKFPLDKELIIFRGKDVMMADKYDFSKHPEASNFRDIRIADRPSINDKIGRAILAEEDKKYMEAYLNNPKSNNCYKNEEEAESINEKFKDGFNRIKNIVKDVIDIDFDDDDEEDTEENITKEEQKIKERADIELEMQDYKEYDNQSVSNDEVVMLDEDEVIIEDLIIEDDEDEETSAKDAVLKSKLTPDESEIDKIFGKRNSENTQQPKRYYRW